MNRIILAIVLFFILGLSAVNAQSRKKPSVNIDSLKTVIENLSQSSPKDVDLKKLIVQVRHSRRKLGKKYRNYLHLVRKYAEKDPQSWALSKIYYRLGIDFRYQHTYDSAMFYYKKARPHIESTNDVKSLVKLYNEMGLVCRKTDRNQEAISNFVESIRYSEKIDYEYGKAIAENGIGNIYLVQKEYLKALQYFKGSLQYGLKNDHKYHQEISYGNIGETYIHLNQPDSAKYYLNKSLKLAQARKNYVGEGICLQCLGQVYLSQKQNKKALEYFKKALELQRKENDKRYLSTILIFYGKACFVNNKLAEAEKSLIEGINISKEIHSVDNLIQGNAILYKIYYNSKRYKDACNALLENKQYTDTLYNAETVQAMNDLEFKYQLTQKNHKIELLNAQKKLVESIRKTERVLFIMIALLLVGLLSLLYYRYRNRQKVTKELQTINTMKSQFFSNVSHEFRTPLTLIKGPVANIIENTNNPQVKNELDMVLRNSNRLLMLVDQLLNLSKIDAGHFSIFAQESDLSMHLKGIANSFNYIAEQKNINYMKNINPSENTWFDVNIIEIIITNLLSNAFKYVHENGTVAIDTKMNEKSYEITISNSDCDLTNRELNFIFNRFYRSDEGGDVEGSGVGLALVKELCLLYKAEIKVKRDSSNFIYFSLVIPTNYEHFTKEQIALIPIDFNEGEVQKTQKRPSNIVENKDENEDTPVLLVVEDNSDMREYIYSCFCKKYKVLMAKDGVEGVDMALQQIPDLIISDVMMPRLDGIELCKQLKSEMKTNHIPLLLLTAKVGDESTLKGLEAGADDYIAKPFNVKTLLAKVSNLTATQRAMREKIQSRIAATPLNVVLQSKDEEFSQRLQKVMDENISNPDFDTELFSKEMLMSRTQLHRKLKAITGLSASAFIRVQRIKKAAEIFCTQDVNITDVCYATGFNTTSYFSKCFKDVMKVTPREYVKQHQANSKE